MIHQQVHVKDMFVWVYVFLSPGITCSLAQACWSKTWAAWHDVCAFAEKKHLGSRHRQIRSDSKIKASQLQSPRFSAESSHKIISGVLECYGKQWESPAPKEFAGISTYILHVKSKRTQKSSSLSVYSGKVSDFYLAAVLLGISTMPGVSYRCAAECRDVVFFSGWRSVRTDVEMFWTSCHSEVSSSKKRLEAGKCATRVIHTGTLSVEGLKLELGEKLVSQPLFIFDLKRMCDPTAPLLSLGFRTFQIRFCMLGPYRSIYFGPWLALLKDVGLDRKRHWPVKRGPSFSSIKYWFNFKAFKLMRSTNKHTATIHIKKEQANLELGAKCFFLMRSRTAPQQECMQFKGKWPLHASMDCLRLPLRHKFSGICCWSSQETRSWACPSTIRCQWSPRLTSLSAIRGHVPPGSNFLRFATSWTLTWPLHHLSLLVYLQRHF